MVVMYWGCFVETDDRFAYLWLSVDRYVRPTDGLACLVDRRP
jgi:hypothetical protein